MPSPDRAQFTEFVADVEPSLRRALSEEFGPEAGREATADALAFAWVNWDRVVAADDSVAYLTKVGETAAERHRPLSTGDVTPILPRSQAAFDALVPPVGAAAAVTRADELASGAPTTMLARPGAAPTVVVRTPGAASASVLASGPGSGSGSGEGPVTMRLPGPPRGPVGPPARRTTAWVVAVVLTGVIALGGIALANRSEGDDGGTVDTSGLPTLPTTVAVATSGPVATAPVAPATTGTTAGVIDTTPITAPPDGDSDGDDDDGGGDGGTSPTVTAAPATTAADTTAPTDPDLTLPPVTEPPVTVTVPPDTTEPTEAPAPTTAEPPDDTAPPRPTVPPNT